MVAKMSIINENSQKVVAQIVIIILIKKQWHDMNVVIHFKEELTYLP